MQNVGVAPPIDRFCQVLTSYKKLRYTLNMEEGSETIF